MILIGGCSFSQSQIGGKTSDNATLITMVRFNSRRKGKLSTSSYGQGMIVRSIIEKLNSKIQPKFCNCSMVGSKRIYI